MKILLAVDGSPYSDAAIEEVLRRPEVAAADEGHRRAARRQGRRMVGLPHAMPGACTDAFGLALGVAAPQHEGLGFDAAKPARQATAPDSCAPACTSSSDGSPCWPCPSSSPTSRRTRSP